MEYSSWDQRFLRCSQYFQIFLRESYRGNSEWQIIRDQRSETSPELELSLFLFRFLVASRDLRCGELVLEEPSLTWAPSLDTEPVCLTCAAHVRGDAKVELKRMEFSTRCFVPASPNTRTIKKNFDTFYTLLFYFDSFPNRQGRGEGLGSCKA